MAVKWIKTGAESAKIAQTDQQEKEQQEAQRGKLWRFFLKDKEEGRITFIDGALGSEGHLEPPRFYEHSLQIAGKWGNYFVCPEKTVPEDGHKCPLCAQGDKPSLVALFTIIDHRQYKTKAGKLMQDQKRLLVAKSVTMEMLTKIAAKRGGLAGCTFDVTRMGENSAAVGSMFDFVEKNDIAKLQATFTETIEDKGVKKTISLFVPADYEQEIIFRTPEEMLKAGIGVKPGFAPGAGMNPGGSTGSTTNYANSL